MASLYCLLLLLSSLLQVNTAQSLKADSYSCPVGLNSLNESTFHNVAWCLPRDYELERPPFVVSKEGSSTQGGPALILDFNFDILEVSEIDDSGQSLTIPMYLSLGWRESRLQINEDHLDWTQNVTGPVGLITEDPKLLLDRIWVPDLEIYGLEEYASSKVLKDMSGVRVGMNKTIEFNQRVTIKVSCRMMFDNYPFDAHLCKFRVGSYFYLHDIVTCTSRYSDPVNSGSGHRQRNLQYVISFTDLRRPEDTTVELSSGNYSACGFRVHLNRKRSQLIFQIYLPCILFVFVSWVSFLIRPQVVPGRMALLVTLFLVLVNIFNTVRSGSPIPSSTQLNAIDTYLVVSIFMVFLALLEYAIVLFAINRQDAAEIARKKSSLRATLDALSKTQPTCNTVADRRRFIQDAIEDINSALIVEKPSWVLLKQDYYKLGRLSVRKFDLIALIVLPVGFLVFNIIYWTHYTNVEAAEITKGSE